MSPRPDPDDLAGRLAALDAKDPFSRALELEVEEVAPGAALLKAHFEGIELNAHGTGHGGATATYHVVLSLDPDDPRTVVAAGSFTGRWPKRR